MKSKKIFFLIVLFAVLYIYMTNIDKIPEKIVLFQNEEYEINHLKGIEIEGNKISKIDKIFNKLTKVNSNIAGNSKLTLSALGGFFKRVYKLVCFISPQAFLESHNYTFWAFWYN